VLYVVPRDIKSEALWVCTCNPSSTWELEVGWTGVQGQDQLQSKSEASLGHMALCLKIIPDNQQMRVSVTRSAKTGTWLSVSTSCVCIVLSSKFTVFLFKLLILLFHETPFL